MRSIAATFLPLLLLAEYARAQALRPDDLLFFSTHKNPYQVASSSRQAYLATENGILVYDYGRRGFVDNLALDGRAGPMHYSEKRNELRILLDGRPHAYNPTFRRFTPTDSLRSGEPPSVPQPFDIQGINLTGGWFHLGDAVRDPWMRRAPVIAHSVFDYDRLWILTAGLGAFSGSARRRSADPAWFGLDTPGSTSLLSDGKMLWIGSDRSSGALVRTRDDLSEWSVLPPGVEQGFPDGLVADMAVWKGYLWLATASGVVRLDREKREFSSLGYFQGLKEERVLSLLPMKDRLCAGTGSGVACLQDPKGDFSRLPFPSGLRMAVFGLAESPLGLWAATAFGLYAYQGGEWVTPEGMGSARGAPVPSVVVHGNALFWVEGDRILRQAIGGERMIVMDRGKPTRLQIDGNLLFVAHIDGVSAYNLKSGQWYDFRLADGIRGTRVQTFLMRGDHLWVATDDGVTRIRARYYLPR